MAKEKKDKLYFLGMVLGIEVRSALNRTTNLIFQSLFESFIAWAFP